MMKNQTLIPTDSGKPPIYYLICGRSESVGNYRCRGLVLLAACFSLLASAADWPQFRGPGGQGHADASGLPTEWDATKNVAWRTEIPGAGWASPIVWRDRIYLTTAVSSPSGNLSLRALCLDARDGKIIWNNEVFSATPVNGHKKNSHASPTPLTDGERLYVHFGPYGTGALDLPRLSWHGQQ